MKKLTSFLLIILFACSSAPSKDLLIGKYCLNRAENRDSIFINKDYTYKHKYLSHTGKKFEIKGTWEYLPNTSEILFKEFLFFNDSEIDERLKGNWFSKVLIDAKTKEIRLMYSSENNIYFFKINNPK